MPVENMLEWVWDTEETTQKTLLIHGNQEVCFHPTYSSGTAAVRGNKPCVVGRDYFWEIEMLTPIYGTDVMVGVGTIKANLKKFQLHFDSLLGSDEESWGFSYKGKLHHNGMMTQYESGFQQGSIVGVHLDMWHGTLTFYLNRQSLGVAFTSLKAQTLYPMVCSTAARSAMRIVCSYSYTSSLQLFCLKAVRSKPVLVDKMHTIPGLRMYAEKAFWHLLPSPVFNRDNKKQPLKRTSDCDESEERNFDGHNEDLCVVCQRPEKMNIQPTTSQGGDQVGSSVISNRQRHSDNPEIMIRAVPTVELFLDNNLYINLTL